MGCHNELQKRKLGVEEHRSQMYGKIQTSKFMENVYSLSIKMIKMMMTMILDIFVSIVIQGLIFFQTKISTVTFQGHLVKLTPLFVTNLYRLFMK